MPPAFRAVNCNEHTNRRREARPKIPRPLGWAVVGLAVVAFAGGDVRSARAEPAPSESDDAPTNGAETSAEDDSSDETGGAVWIFREIDLSDEKADAFRRSLEESTAQSGRRHLLSRGAFREYVAARSAKVPPCLKGLSTCPSVRAQLFDQLDLTATVELDLRRDGETLVAAYRVRDRRGDVSKKSKVRAGEPDALALALVGDLFDATGTVRFESEPPGARVIVGDEPVGTAPLETRLPVGSHDYRFELGDRRDAKGSFQLASGETRRIEATLESSPGELVIEDAPEGAEVIVDGERAGRVGETISLEPGAHELTVRADGYETYRQTIHVDADDSLKRSIPLRAKNPLLRDVAADKIAINNYVARLTLEQSLHPTSFLDARGRTRDSTYEFAGFANDAGQLPADEVVRRLMAPTGFRFDFTYTTRRLGVVLASLSYLSAGVDREAYVDTSRRSGDRRRATVTGVRRLQLRPFQVTARHFFGNFVPSVELGTGLTFQWINLSGLGDGGVGDTGRVGLRQTEAFWTIGFAGQYFFDPNWFAVARYGAQDYFNLGRGVEHLLSLGVGVAYPNLFGFEPEPPEEL